MNPIRRWLFSLALAALLLAALGTLATLAQAPEQPWLVRLSCRDEATLARLRGSGLRLLLWEQGQLYALTSAGQRRELAAQGLAPEILNRQAAEGEYCVLYAAPAAASALAARYGPLVALGEGFYLLGLPPDAPANAPLGSPYVRRLPHELPPLSAAPPQAAPPLRSLAGLAAAVSPERLTHDIDRLQDDDDIPGPDALRSRFSLLPGLDAEGAYLAQELQAAGLAVSYQPFTVTDHALQASRPVSNIIASRPGLWPDSEGFYIVCAHYDSTASRGADWPSLWRTSPAPGADDNASGAAVVLEVARVLAERPLVYGLHFALFAGEEQGLQGSRAYALALRASGARVLGVINLDMVAYDGNGDGKVEVHAGPRADSQALAEVLVRNMARYAPELEPTIKTAGATTRSDHASFWDQGYPALLLIEDWNEFTPHYHSAQDTLDALNMPYCTGIVRATVATLGELARLSEPDLAASRMTAALSTPLLAEVAYTITLQNSGLVTATSVLTDVLPPALSLASPIGAGQGTPTWDAAARRLGWSGEIAPGGAVTISFQARLDPWWPGGTWVHNSALVSDGCGALYPLSAPLRAPWRWWKPLAARSPGVGSIQPSGLPSTAPAAAPVADPPAAMSTLARPRAGR